MYNNNSGRRNSNYNGNRNNGSSNGFHRNNYQGNNRYNSGNNNRGGFRKYNNNGYNNNNSNATPQINIPTVNGDREARIADLIDKQKKNIEILEKAISYLNTRIADTANTVRITMKDVLASLNEAGYNAEDTKAVSQFNYMLVDLANAQKNIYIRGDRVNIRVQYIKERFITSYRRELYNTINDLFIKNDLFKLDNSNDKPAENTTTVEEKAQ